ncbi:transglutaminase N-terminal domain-containing protein [Alteromonas flava]|uniref:transglutaminase N-terminal domain-containing protein n=1 Tax=Alteromonas flava TaxID=2048003 RepID=UPI000C285FC3|nr:transglutaminase N-terminal domain-containing protein [Alteromonas flava]
MKRFKIVHKTVYDYAKTVQLQPHALRLRSREGHDHHIESFQLTISPQASLKWHRDVEGNSVATAAFSEPTQCLKIKSETIVQKYDVLPHDFLIADFAVSYPFAYPAEDRKTLSPYLSEDNYTCYEALKNWVHVVWDEKRPFQTFELLLLINQQIYQSIGYKEAFCITSSLLVFLNGGQPHWRCFLFSPTIRSR